MPWLPIPSPFWIVLEILLGLWDLARLLIG